MCANPGSEKPALINGTEDCVLISSFLRFFSMNECGIIGHTFDRMTHLAFVTSGLTERECPLILIFIFSAIILSASSLEDRYIQIRLLAIRSANLMLLGLIILQIAKI